VEEARDGDAQSETELVRRFAVPLKCILLRLTRNADVANDLAQDVMLSVLQALRSGRILDHAALPAYIQHSARNAALMWQRRPKPDSMAELPEVDSMWAQAPRTPLEHCEDVELKVLARQVLQELPTDRDRQLILGFYVHGLEKADLMQRFGLNRDQFDRVISRARLRMRDLIKAKMNSPGAEVREVVPAVVLTSNASRPT